MILNSYFNLKTATTICMVALLAFMYETTASPINDNTSTVELFQNQDSNYQDLMTQHKNAPTTRKIRRTNDKYQTTETQTDLYPDQLQQQLDQFPFVSGIRQKVNKSPNGHIPTVGITA
ncbi:hypothetical protein BDF19DRAFT_422413 [Syncephalis fuscata]|nr:hypothetical protein BDF19DRAFT_422413 [Syncephalis fuscata]